jgi:hypothetical protein
MTTTGRRIMTGRVLVNSGVQECTPVAPSGTLLVVLAGSGRRYILLIRPFDVAISTRATMAAATDRADIGTESPSVLLTSAATRSDCVTKCKTTHERHILMGFSGLKYFEQATLMVESGIFGVPKRYCLS